MKDGSIMKLIPHSHLIGHAGHVKVKSKFVPVLN